MPYLLKIALRNVGRNRRRTALTMSALAIAVAALTFGQGYLRGALNGIFDNYARIQSGHVRIVHKGYIDKERLLPLDLAVEDYQAIKGALADIEGAEVAAGRLKFGAMLDLREVNENAFGIGVEPEGERGIMSLDRYIVEGSYFSGSRPEMLMGAELAEKLRADIGDTITVISRTAYRSITAMNFRLTGKFKLGFSYIDESSFYIPIGSAQELLDMEGGATEIIVMGSHRDEAPKLARRINDVLRELGIEDCEALPWQSQGDLYSAISTSRISMGFIFGIIAFIAGLAVVNTMLMAVFERTREIGMMMALGMKGTEIWGLFLLESVVIGLLGGAAGAALGSGLSLLIESRGIHLGGAMRGISMPIGDVIHADFMIRDPLGSFACGVGLVILAALYPAFRASKLEPTEALRD